MDTLLKSKGLWQCTNIVIPDPVDALVEFVVNRKKNEIGGVIMTYISQEIWFYTSGIDCFHEVWRKMRSLFDKVDKSWVIQIEKELISLDPYSFEMIEDYLACIKEL